MNSGDYRDDPTIADEDPLWRRIPPWHVVPDGSGGVRASSAAFEDHAVSRAMSVTLGKDAQNAGRDPASCLVGFLDFSIVAVQAGFARQHLQGIQRDPTKDDPAHALVFGGKANSVRRKLARAAVWILPPPQHLVDSKLR